MPTKNKLFNVVLHALGNYRSSIELSKLRIIPQNVLAEHLKCIKYGTDVLKPGK